MSKTRDMDRPEIRMNPEPVGFVIHHDRHGYYANMLTRYSNSDAIETAYAVGRSRFKARTERLATAEWSRMHHDWQLERDDVGQRVILVPPSTGPNGKAGA